MQQQLGPPSVVVANAGVAGVGSFLQSDADTWRRVIEVNLIGSSLTARAFVPGLLTTRGYYLQVASLARMTAAPMMSAYCASKSGVEAFAHALRAEVAHRGVDVGIAYLSWADTDMINAAVLRELRARLPWPALVTRGKGRRPGRRRPARPCKGAAAAAGALGRFVEVQGSGAVLAQ